MTSQPTGTTANDETIHRKPADHRCGVAMSNHARRSLTVAGGVVVAGPAASRGPTSPIARLPTTSAFAVAVHRQVSSFVGSRPFATAVWP
jgi:hypothetical protein